MEVNLSLDLEAKLARIASQRGCDAEAVAREAIERVVNYDEWFMGEVDKPCYARRRPLSLSAEWSAGQRVGTLRCGGEHDSAPPARTG